MHPDRGVYSNGVIPASLCVLGSENKKPGMQKGLGTGTRRTIRVEKLRGNNLLGERECTGNRKISQTGRNQILGRCPRRGSERCPWREVWRGGVCWEGRIGAANTGGGGRRQSQGCSTRQGKGCKSRGVKRKRADGL